MMKFAALAIVALFTTETQAVQVSTESKLQMRAQIDSAIDSYLNADESSGAEAEWGFLKNIVNIDSFFSSGAASDKSEKKSSKKEAVAKIEEGSDLDEAADPKKPISFKSHFKDLKDDSLH